MCVIVNPLYPNECRNPLWGFIVCHHGVADAASAFSKTVWWHSFKETLQKCISFTSWWSLQFPSFLRSTIAHPLLLWSLGQIGLRASKTLTHWTEFNLKKVFIWQNHLSVYWDYFYLTWVVWGINISSTKTQEIFFIKLQDYLFFQHSAWNNLLQPQPKVPSGFPTDLPIKDFKMTLYFVEATKPPQNCTDTTGLQNPLFTTIHSTLEERLQEREGERQVKILCENYL